MNIFASHPLLCFFACSLVLCHIYGFSWTLVIILTLYIIDRTFRDTSLQRIQGKSINGCKAYDKRGFVSPPPIVLSPINMSANKDHATKRPTLQSLLYKGRSSSDGGASTGSPRQPLAAIVKNNLSMNVRSPTIDLERKKPIFQTLRGSSPVRSPSVYTAHNASPLARRMRSGLNLASPLSARLTPPVMNNSFTYDRSLNDTTAPNETLEVHGSYFINKSILSSPSCTSGAGGEKAATPTTPQRYFSPSNVTFNTDTKHGSPCVSKTSTESVVQALKEKSKRKRGNNAAATDEACTKKKKNNECDFDTTLNELLPGVPSEKGAKRRNIDSREVMSTGVQCFLGDDEMSARKRKKQATTTTAVKPKFGVTQGELNNLSQEIDETATNTTALAEMDTTVKDLTTAAEKVSAGGSVPSDSSVRNGGYNCSFKSVSFADNSLMNGDVATPEKRLSSTKTGVAERLVVFLQYNNTEVFMF